MSSGISSCLTIEQHPTKTARLLVSFFGIERLNWEVNAVLADPAVKVRMAELGSEIFIGWPADFGKLVAEETEKWAKVIRAANIKAE